MIIRSVLKGTVQVKLKVTVYVNPRHPTLLEIATESEGVQSFADVLRSEVQSNLESLGYVSHVSVEPI